MLKELEEAFGFHPIFILDSNILRGSGRANYIMNHLIQRDEDTGIHHMPTEMLGKLLARSLEIEFLLENTRTFVIQEVKDEIRDYITFVKRALHTKEEKKRFGSSNTPYREKLDLLGTYVKKLESIREKMNGKDPRKKDFGYTENYQVDANTQLYAETFSRATNLLTNSLIRKGKLTGSQKPKPTDAHIFALAHVLEKSECATCIISNDLDFFDIARTFQNKFVIKELAEKRGVARNITSPGTDYSISLFNPLFIEPIEDYIPRPFQNNVYFPNNQDATQAA